MEETYDEFGVNTKNTFNTPPKKLDRLTCPKCKKTFGIEQGIIGVITCPYCAEYVEGM